jgi:hypothetical protein
MAPHIFKISGLFTLLVLASLGTARVARGADGMAERYRMQRYYECCYGPSHYGPNGYVRRMNWWRTAYCDGANCDEKGGCLCRHCCCGKCLVPGSEPPSRCLDICLYHIVWPISPWYSNPRDGICYPAFGSKSPTCVPQKD